MPAIEWSISDINRPTERAIKYSASSQYNAVLRLTEPSRAFSVSALQLFVLSHIPPTIRLILHDRSMQPRQHASTMIASFPLPYHCQRASNFDFAKSLIDSSLLHFASISRFLQ